MVLGHRRAVDDSVLGKRKVYRPVEGMRYRPLAIVVVDLYVIKSLKVSEVVEEEVRYAAAHCRLHMPYVSVLREPERNAGVAHG